MSWRAEPTRSALNYEVLCIYDASGLHVTCLERLEHSNLEIAINEMAKQIQLLQVAGQGWISIGVTCTASTAFEIGRIAVNPKKMMRSNLPKAVIRISAVVNGQAAVDTY